MFKILTIPIILLIIVSIFDTSNVMRIRDSKGKLFPGGPVVISPGESITLECNYNGTMSWSRRNKFNSKSESLRLNKKIKINRNKLTIKNISSADASIYYCVNEGFFQRFSLKVNSNFIKKRNKKSFKVDGISSLLHKEKIDKTKLLEKYRKSKKQRKTEVQISQNDLTINLIQMINNLTNKFIKIKNELERKLDQQKKHLNTSQKETTNQLVRFKIEVRKEIGQLNKEIKMTKKELTNKALQIKKELVEKSDKQIKQLNKYQKELQNNIIQIKKKLDCQKHKQKKDKFQCHLKLSTINSNYATAIKYCQSHGMNLIKIQDQATDRIIYNFSKLHNLHWYWINGSYNRKKSKWLNSDNGYLNYTNWSLGQPDDARGNEDCIHGNFNLEDNWNDLDCSRKLTVICYTDSLSSFNDK